MQDNEIAVLQWNLRRQQAQIEECEKELSIKVSTLSPMLSAQHNGQKLYILNAYDILSKWEFVLWADVQEDDYVTLELKYK